jgi:hypothetical protein
VVDAHQRGGVLALRGAQLRLGQARARRRPRGLGDASNGAQRPVEFTDQVVDLNHGSRLAEMK